MKKIKDQPADSVTSSSVPSREELEKKLQLLALSPSPRQLSKGAMCYSPAFHTERLEYVCPVCHGKTIYEYNDTIYEIDYYRRLVKQLNDNGLDCKIDESSFCHKCGKGVKTSELILETKWAGEDEPHRVVLKEPEDLELVLEFITGKDRHTGAGDREFPLKEYLIQISKIIGISTGDKSEKDFLKEYLAGIKKDALNISDRELCLLAIEKEAFALTRIPETFKTREFYLAAVILNKEAIQYVPREFLDREFFSGSN